MSCQIIHVTFDCECVIIHMDDIAIVITLFAILTLTFLGTIFANASTNKMEYPPTPSSFKLQIR